VALVPGMYFSVEPGLYVDPTDTLAPAAFRGIGIRIEDDVLVTETGNEVLTGGIAKEVAQLENRY
jgi:Xaa-Pro aminopeptidase